MTTSATATITVRLKKFAALIVIAAMVIATTPGNVSSRDTQKRNEASSQNHRSQTSVLKTKVIWDLAEMLAATGGMLKDKIGKVSGNQSFSGKKAIFKYDGKYKYWLTPGTPVVAVTRKTIKFAVPAQLHVVVSGNVKPFSSVVSIDESRACRNIGINPYWTTSLKLDQDCRLAVGKTSGGFRKVAGCSAMVNVDGKPIWNKSLDATINGEVERTVDSGSKEINQHVTRAVPSVVASHQMLDLGEPLPLVEGMAWLSVNVRAMTISRFWGDGSNLHMDLELIAEPDISFGTKPPNDNFEVPCQLSGSSARSTFTVPLTMHLPLVGLKTVDINQSCQNAKGFGAFRFIPISDKQDRAIVLINNGSSCKPLMYLSGSSVMHRGDGKASPTAVDFNRSLTDLLSDIARWLGPQGPLANVSTAARKQLRDNVASLKTEFETLEKQKFDLILGENGMRLTLDGVSVHVGTLWMDDMGINAELTVSSPATAELKL